MKITYLYHSCFIVELERHILLFDYFKGMLPNFDPSKELVVFVSHQHADHFNKAIFNIVHPRINYILSNDITQEKTPEVSLMEPHEQIVIKDIEVRTLASTDLGVAFLIKAEGKTIYHAGDLHWWDWQMEDSEEEKRIMQEAYQTEINRINETIDVAFVPVDPRLNSAYDKGIRYFMEHVQVQYVFPMHFGDEITVIDRLLNDHNTPLYKDRIINIRHEREEFNFL